MWCSKYGLNFCTAREQSTLCSFAGYSCAAAFCGGLVLTACCVSVVGCGHFRAWKVVLPGSAVPDHSLAPHHVIVLHIARARLAAGPSLVAGVDTPPEPVVRGSDSCLDAALQPPPSPRSGICFLGGVRVTRARLTYAMETPHSSWTGRPRSGCSNSASLQEAQGHCENTSRLRWVHCRQTCFPGSLGVRAVAVNVGTTLLVAPLWEGIRVV